MSGHDSICSPNVQYPGPGALRGAPVQDGFDSSSSSTSKRQRDGPSWEGSVKRIRRDDFDQQDHDPQASQYNSPATLYDHFPTHQASSSTAYVQQQQQQQPNFANAAAAPFPSQHNIDPAIQSYGPGPQHQQQQQQQQYRDHDAAFGQYHSAQPHQQQFANPWGMPPHTQPGRAHQQSPQNHFYQGSDDYASSHMPSQAPFMPSLSAQDWTQPSYSYTGGTDHWNYQIDEPTVYGEDASVHLKIQSIPTLDNLSTQIIMNLARGSLPDILLLTAGRNYEESQAYFTRRTLFDQTRKVFTRSSVFIDLNVSQHMFTASQQEVVRKANRATFISSILEGHDISFYDLDARFLDTFVPTGQRLLKWQGTVFLELKTQAYIAALMNNDGPLEVLLNELFPSDLEQRLTARHPDAANIAPSEQDFLDRARARRQYLLSEPPFDALHNLRNKYGWQDFLREFATCINKNVEAIINNPARTPSSTSFSPRVGRLSQSPAARYHPYYSPHLAQQRPPMGGPQGLMPSHTPQPQPPTNQQIHNVQQQQHQGRASASATPDPGEATASPNLKPKSGKAAKSSGGSGTPRQPWKQEEEDALLAGLAEVNGPHWSQILSLYGRGGSVSEVLKDRNQIQLKDKARNLKLWYLKMGNEVPACLRGVTGELRKRGGARVRAALGLTDEDEKSAKKKGSPLGKSGHQGGQSGPNLAPQIDPSL